jgi:hypothetical protein
MKNYLLCFMLFSLALPTHALGQTAATAKISGLVTNPAGAVIPGAVVRLTGKVTKTERVTRTDGEGRYVLAALEPGGYELTFTAAGFRQTTVSDLQAQVAKAATVDVTLEVGGANEEVTIRATGQAELQRDDAAIGHVLTADQILRLPTADRRITSLLALQPGTQPSGEVTGARGDQSAFNLDGIDVSDNVVGLPFRTVIPATAETIGELRVTVANANATFGRAAGAQVTLVTRRGSSDFYGALYEHHQNAALNANSWTNNRLGLPRPPLVDNRFGGSLGGPALKRGEQRAFFFFNYEGRRRPGSFQTTRIVPTASLRAGQLRFRDAAGEVVTVDPKSFDPRSLGANALILRSLASLPLPNNPSFGDGLNTGGFTFNYPTPLRDDFGLLRLNYHAGANWTVEATAAANRLLVSDPPTPTIAQVDLVNRRLTRSFPERPRHLTFALTGAVRTGLVNEVRVGHVYDHRRIGAMTPATGGGFDVAVDLAPSPLASDPAFQLLDEPVDVDGGRARSLRLLSGTTQFVDNATWGRGAHTFQFGGSLRRIAAFMERNEKIGAISTPVAQVGTAGNVVVSAAERPPTCDAAGGLTRGCLVAGDLSRYNQFYAALLGVVDNVSLLAVRDAELKPLPAGTGLVNDVTLRHWEFYFADAWRVRPSLTLSYGLMYQWHTPPRERLGRQTVAVYGGTRELVAPRDYLRRKREAAERGEIFNPDLAYLPIRESGRAGVFETNRRDFSPRVSAAWQPTPGGWRGRLFGGPQAVWRSGYALSYDRANTVSTVAVPQLGVGFSQSLSVRGPVNGTGQPFRIGVDGRTPVPSLAAAASPIVPDKPFGELVSFLVDPQLADPRNHTFTLTFQRELPGGLIVEAGYVARLGRALYQNVNLNSVPYFFKDRASGQSFAQAFDAVARQLRGGAASGQVTPQPWFENQLGAGLTQVLAGEQAGSFVNGNLNDLWNVFLDFLAPRPYNNQQVLDLFFRTSQGRSNYHAFVASAQQRVSRGLTFHFNYTLSKSLDQVGEVQDVVDEFSTSFFPDVDYGPSFFDRRHVVSAHWVYDLPFGQGRRFGAGGRGRRFLAGWHVAGIVTAASGLPLSVSQGLQVYGGSLILAHPTGAILTGRPDFGNDVHRGVKGSGGVGDAGDAANGGSGLNLFADPARAFSRFRPVELSRDSRAGRGTLRGLPSWNVDLSVGKSLRLGERASLRLTLSAFNLFNHVVFANPALDLQNRATFGVISAQANAARSALLSGRLEF